MKRIFKTLLKKAVKHKRLIKLVAIELFFIALLIVADLLTKVYIYGAAKTADITIIKGVLKFVAEDNTGASFGMLKDSTTALAFFSAICTVALLTFLVYTINNRNKLFRSALILIIGGAAGNLYDRFALGYVRDFVYFELINYAVFNFADSALTIGSILFLIYVIFYYNETAGFSAKKKGASGEVEIIDEQKPVDNLQAEEASKAKEEVQGSQESNQDNG